MTSESKPVIIIVPGAWHVPMHYAHLSLHLNSKGYTVSCLELPSGSPASELPSEPFAADVACIREAIVSHVDAGRDVILLMHSYGGICGGEAANGLGQTEAKAGVVRLVYLAAFMLQEGVGFGMLDREMFPVTARLSDEDPTLLVPLSPETMLYADVPSHLTTRALANLRTLPLSIGATAVPHHPAWRSIPVSYILCENDAAIPPKAADFMIDAVKAQGVDVKVERLAAGHSPFLSCPGRTAEVVVELIA